MSEDKKHPALADLERVLGGESGPIEENSKEFTKYVNVVNRVLDVFNSELGPQTENQGMSLPIIACLMQINESILKQCKEKDVSWAMFRLIYLLVGEWSQR